jgi:GNAT superfamily N-acetyltransferase
VSSSPILCDIHLARRLETVELLSNVAFIEARSLLEPETGATWAEVAGAGVMFDGPESVLTQTFGLGLFGEADEAALDEIESFYASRGAPVYHEVSPLAPIALLELLGRRGYRPVDLTTVMFRALSPGPAPEPPAGMTVRRTAEDEADQWAGVAAEGWRGESEEIGAFVEGMGRVLARARGCYAFIAEIDGEAVAAANQFIGDGATLLAGASTVPRFRQRGAQRALLEARLALAAEKGCDLAVMGALPGSASQRNAERQGFRIAYTRIKWKLHPAGVY